MLTLLMLGVVLMSGCSRDDSGEVGGAVASVELRLEQPPSTRAVLTDIEESDITSADVLVFDRDGAYLYRQVGTILGEAGTESRSVLVDLQLTSGSPVDLWVIVNAHAKVAGLELDGLSKVEVTGLLIFDETDGVTQYGLNDPVPIPMFGELSGAEIDLNGLVESSPIPLIRMLSRIDVIRTDRCVYDLVSVSLYNSASQGLLVYDGSKLSLNTSTGARYLTGLTLPVDLGIVNGTEGSKKYPLGGRDTLVRAIYAFETPACSGPGFGDVFADELCLVICLQFEAPSMSSDGLQYYRVDLRNSAGEYLPLIRNRRYEVKIGSVTGRGSSTPEQARSSTLTDLSASVVEWYTQDIGYDD
jgi:hypothetical protein